MVLRTEQKRWLELEYSQEYSNCNDDEQKLEALFSKYENKYNEVSELGCNSPAGNEEKAEASENSNNEWQRVEVNNEIKDKHLSQYTTSDDGYVDASGNKVKFQQKGNNYQLITQDSNGNPRNPKGEELDALVASLEGKNFKLSKSFDKDSLNY